MSINLYRVFYILMLIGFAGCSIGAKEWKGMIIGVCLVIVNGLLFYK